MSDTTSTPEATPASLSAPAAPASSPSAIDIQTQINQALLAERAEFATQLEQATGHKDIKSLTDAQLKAQGKLQELSDSHAATAAAYKTKFEQSAIKAALLSAASEAVDAATIGELLSGKALCDDNGIVTIDGKPVADAIKQLLIDKPFLAKAQGGPGGGAPQNTGGGKSATRAAFDALPAAERSAFIKNGGTITA